MNRKALESNGLIIVIFLVASALVADCAAGITRRDLHYLFLLLQTGPFMSDPG
ncbi:MAG: hypothetical protein IPK60_11790 [Sandaracinaceae bacterium]|nr:hypothetical protein [Sandaracinaceae bacterium]